MEEKTQETSMEDILSSIRTILEEDGKEEAVPSTARASDALETDEDDMITPEADETPFELTDAMSMSAEQGTHNQEAQGESILVAADEEEVADEHDGPLLSTQTAAAAVAAFSQLTEKTTHKRDIEIGDGQATIEGMVRDLMRPMLSQWLNANLTNIVEAIIREEVERLIAARGRC